MESTLPVHRDRSVVVGLFDREPSARELVDAVRRLGVDEHDVGVLTPGERPSVSQTPAADVSGLLALAASASDGSDVGTVLLSLGLPEGEARFYAQESREGRTLVVFHADGQTEELRKLVLAHGGYDVQSRGRDFLRSGPTGRPGGTGALPMDVTHNWDDFSSRYQMLWQQHYGTTEATWDQVEPLYRCAWQLANEPRYRGRTWAEVESELRRDWQSSPLSERFAWPEVATGPLRDVWEDVGAEAASGAEGGADRRIARQGTDQSVAAREIAPPERGAA